ncbi:MAG: hypothetical protein LBH22_06635, partial [Bacteroidales bacterium]|nr:hypothetical protein [Bacteroidales bacterium]
MRKSKIMLPFVIMGAMLAVSCKGPNIQEQDWTQWRGPNNEGIVNNTNLNLDWHEKTPALSWVFRQTGAGYSSPVVVGTTLYMTGADDDGEFAFALDTRTGD